MTSDQEPRVYEVSGRFSDGFYYHTFRKYVVANSPQRAQERVLSEVGSKHHVKRGQIRVEAVSEVKDLSAVDDPLIKQMMQVERRER